MCPPSDLMDLLHRNAVMVLEAAKQLESGPAGGCSLPQKGGERLALSRM